MKQVIDIETWERRDMYNFFKDFVNPTYSVTVDVECTQAWSQAKASGQSFFTYCLYAIAKASNEITELRYRITVEKRVLLYDKIDMIIPVKVNEKGKFVSVRIPYHPQFEVFYPTARRVIGAVSAESNPYTTNDKSNDNEEVYSQMNVSILPDLYFTSAVSTQQYPHGNDFPLVNIGKVIDKGGRLYMPVAINVHHGLVDGHHLTLFYKRVEELLMNGF